MRVPESKKLPQSSVEERVGGECYPDKLLEIGGKGEVKMYLVGC